MNAAKPHKRRWVRGALNVVIPLAPLARFRDDAAHTRDSVSAAWGELMRRIRAARERTAGAPIDIVIPSEEEARGIVANARTVWWACIGVILLGVSLGALAMHAHSVLMVINTSVASVALVIVGTLNALDAARVVAEVSEHRRIEWKEFRQRPAWFIPY